MRRSLSAADVAVLLGPARVRRLGIPGGGRVQLKQFLRRRMWRLRLEELDTTTPIRFERFGAEAEIGA